MEIIISFYLIYLFIGAFLFFVEIQVYDLYNFFSLENYFNISCRADLLVKMPSFLVCLRVFISPLLLKNNFGRYRFLVRFFFLQHFKYITPLFLLSWFLMRNLLWFSVRHCVCFFQLLSRFSLSLVSCS